MEEESILIRNNPKEGEKCQSIAYNAVSFISLPNLYIIVVHERQNSLMFALVLLLSILTLYCPGNL